VNEMIRTTQKGFFEKELFAIDRSLDGLFRTIRPSTPSKSRLYDVNIENLKTVIEYLIHMKNMGRLNDKELSDLITQACSSFVENEIVSAFNKVFVKTLKELFEEFEDE
jgi:hypothetical protein